MHAQLVGGEFPGPFPATARVRPRGHHEPESVLEFAAGHASMPSTRLRHLWDKVLSFSGHHAMVPGQLTMIPAFSWLLLKRWFLEQFALV